MAIDTFALTWNIVKRGRGDKKYLKRGRRFEMQSNITYQSKYGPFTHKRTIQFNSGSRDISMVTQIRKDPYIICMGKRGRGIEDQHQLTYHINMHSLEGAKYPAYFCRIISAHHSEYISKYRESEVSMSDVYLFLVRASQISAYTLGVQSFKTMDTVSQESIYYY